MPSMTANDITKLATRLTRYWEPRTKQMELERKIRDLDVQESVTPDKQLLARALRVIDNHPQVYWDWVVASLSNNPFKWTSPMQVTVKDGGKSKGDLERMAYGFDWQLDEYTRATCGESWRYYLAEQIASGWYAVCPNIMQYGDSVYATLDFYDPITVFQQPGVYGFEYIIRDYKAPLFEVKGYASKYGKSVANLDGDDTQNVHCIELWHKDGSEVFHSFLADDKEVLPYEKTEWDDIPLLTGAVGGRGKESNMDAATTARNFGRGILTPLVRVYQQANLTRTMARARMRKSTFPDMKDVSLDGNGIVDEADLGANVQNTFHLRQGEEVEYVPMPPTPLDVRAELEHDQQLIVQGSVPPQMFGANTPELASGYLGQILKQLGQIRLGRQESAFVSVGERVMRRLFSLMKKRKLTIELTGKDLRVRGLDGFYIEQFSYTQIPDNYILKADHDIQTPVDKASISQVANTNVAGNLWTIERGMEETGVEDTYGEFMKMLQEKAALSAMGNIAIMAVQFEREAEKYANAGDMKMADAFRKQAAVVRQQAAMEAAQMAAGAGAQQTNKATPGMQSQVLPASERNPNMAPPAGPQQQRFGNTNAARSEQ